MTTYIGNKQIRHVLYFNRNKNTIISSDQIVDKNYMDTNNRHEYYNDMFVILTDPSIYIADRYYGSLEDVPNFIFYNNTFIFKKQIAYSSTMYHSTKPITRKCNYKIQKITPSSWGHTYFNMWTYTYDGYTFNYKKESWYVDSDGISTEITVEDEGTIYTNEMTALIIKGPTTSNNTYDVITYKISTSDMVIVPYTFDTYENISKLYAGEELVHENT